MPSPAPSNQAASSPPSQTLSAGPKGPRLDYLFRAAEGGPGLAAGADRGAFCSEDGVCDFLTEGRDVPLLVTPHPLAPFFNVPDAQLAFEQVLAEVAGGNYPANEAFLSIFRQAALVNLFFFLKYIASFSAPFDKLERNLHGEVCNARQMALEPGARYALVLPRSSFKSTTWTPGGTAWEVWRDRNLRVGIFSFPADRSQDFMAQVRAIFENNLLLHELDPSVVPPKGRGARWNDSELVMPGRTMDFVEASVTAYTAGGATQGIHLDLANFDDVVGDSMLNANRGATADMISMTNWVDDNQNVVLQNPMTARIVFPFTRYSPQDPGEKIMLHSRRHLGNWYNVADKYPRDEEGLWTTYYRSARKPDGESIFPSQYSTQFLNKLQKEKPATYQLNYANDPFIPEVVEFATYGVKPAELVWDDVLEMWFISFPNEKTRTPLAGCCLIQALDPAATDHFVSVRTSRTAHVILARTAQDRYVFLRAHAGFVKTTEWFDWLWGAKKRFGDMLGGAYAELVAGFRSLESIVADEVIRRNEGIGFEAVGALGDKDVTIRNILQPVLEAGQVYAVEDAAIEIEKELAVFPAGSYKDILDAMKIAVKKSWKPSSDEELEDEDERERREDAYVGGRSRTTGY